MRRDLYRVDILALEGPSQFWVKQRVTVLLPSMQTGSGTLFSSCRKLRRSPRDLKAAGVTTRFRRSLDWKDRAGEGANTNACRGGLPTESTALFRKDGLKAALATVTEATEAAATVDATEAADAMDSYRDRLLVIDSDRCSAGFDELGGCVYQRDVAKSWLELHIRQLEVERLHGAAARSLGGVANHAAFLLPVSKYQAAVYGKVNLQVCHAASLLGLTCDWTTSGNLPTMDSSCAFNLRIFSPSPPKK
ncbi:MAG: hypothetical protein FRX49_01115 [Trebouxia sp. A1-2]|nr:MAG: hypothetical protein FRX49_01115 [Trebouxia sp. A1-2]